MRRLTFLPLLALLLGAWSLANCGPAPTPVAVSTVLPISAILPTPTSTPSSTATPTSVPTVAPSPIPTLTLSPTAAFPPTPSPTPPPTLPPLRSPVAGEPLAFSLSWQFSSNGHLTDALLLRRDGQPLLVMASLGRAIYALDGEGRVAWRARTQGPVYALARLAGGELVAGDDAGFVTLLGADGRRRWRRKLGSRVTALRGWRGGALAGGWDEALTFLSADGEVVWRAAVGGPVSGLAVWPARAAAATLDGAVLAFDPTGTEVWRFEAGAPVTALGTVGERVLVGVQDGRLLALDMGGTLRWQRTLGAADAGGPVWRAADVVGDAALEVIVGTGGEAPLLALLSAEGEALWRVAVPAQVGAIAALDLDGDGEREVLAGLSSGQVQAYDGQGRQRGEVHAGLSVWGLEAGGDGAALVLADVVAWRLVGGAGRAGGPWLPPPPLLPAPPDPLPPEVERAEGEAILVFLGDVALGRSMEAQLARYGPAHPWAGLGPLLREADLAVANLEGVLTTRGTPLDKSYLIRAHPRWGRSLVEAGLDLVTAANNHALDFGPAGLDETLDTLAALGIAAVGAAGEGGEEAHRPALFTLNGVRVAVLGYLAARWYGSVDVPATDALAWAEPGAVQADVRAARKEADVVVVLLHAGAEYAAAPSADQTAVAHAAVDAGADLVVGHHPHVTQTVERYGSGLIVYSLGDALFDIPRPAAMRGHLLRVHVTRAGVAQAELWPFWIEDAIRPRLLDDGQGGPRFSIPYTTP